MAVIIDQTRPDQPNADYLYDKEYYKDTFIKKYFHNKKLTHKIINDCYVLPFTPLNEGGIFDSEGRYIQNSSFRSLGGSPKGNNNTNPILSALAEEQGLNLSEVPHKKQTVVFIGIISSVWGHFITDCMRMLWFLRTKEYAENFSDCQIIYLPAQNFEVKGSYKRMFEILGIDCLKLMPLKNLTKYDKVILPEECFNLSNIGFTTEYITTINAVRDFAIANSQITQSNKIYYSYSKYNGYRSSGEDKLEKYFASKGYKIIYPEEHSLDDQLNLLINCVSFASTIGSCSHNIIFLRDNTEVILIPRAHYLTGYQEAINQVHKLNINYVDSSFSIFVGRVAPGGPFLYFISSNLRKFFHDEDTQSIIDASDFRKYFVKAFGYNFDESFKKRAANPSNLDAYKYYSTVAAEYLPHVMIQSWHVKIRALRDKIPFLFVARALKKFIKKLLHRR